MGSDQAGELADAIERSNLELIQLVQGCSEEQLKTSCNEEGETRTVAVIAHHVAHGHRYIQDWLEAALAGREVTVTRDEINTENAEHAATFHEVDRAETVRLLTELGARFCARVAALEDQELARSALHRGAGREMTVADFAGLGRRHVAGHLATIRAALEL